MLTVEAIEAMGVDKFQKLTLLYNQYKSIRGYIEDTNNGKRFPDIDAFYQRIGKLVTDDSEEVWIWDSEGSIVQDALDWMADTIIDIQQNYVKSSVEGFMDKVGIGDEYRETFKYTRASVIGILLEPYASVALNFKENGLLADIFTYEEYRNNNFYNLYMAIVQLGLDKAASIGCEFLARIYQKIGDARIPRCYRDYYDHKLQILSDRLNNSKWCAYHQDVLMELENVSNGTITYNKEARILGVQDIQNISTSLQNITKSLNVISKEVWRE